MPRLHRTPAATQPAAGDASAAAPASAAPPVPTPVVGQLRPRRSPRLVAAGVLLACLGGLGAAFAYQQGTHSNQVVVLARTVPRGQTITAADLTTVTIGPAPGVHTVPGDQMPALVGKQALVDLPEGSLVGQESVGTAALAQGSAQVGLRLAAGRIPNQPMPPGTPVSLVEVSSDKDATTSSGLVVEATLVTAPQTMPDGSSHVVDVAVPQAQAERLAELAAHDRLVLVRKAGG